jgi:hypothetical protein
MMPITRRNRKRLGMRRLRFSAGIRRFGEATFPAGTYLKSSG